MLFTHFCMYIWLSGANSLVDYQASNTSQFNPCSYAATDVLVRDIVVIGGGASGTYGAIALKDEGHTVAVVEKQPHFGGHVNTYDDPATGLALEYGVMGYSNDTTTRAFFSRFNVSLGPLNNPAGSLFVDFTTGQEVPFASRNGNFTPYLTVVNKYYPDPAAGVHLPSPVPPELLMPFRDFIKKFSLQQEAYTIWSYSGPDDNLLDQLTLYAFLGANSASAALLGGRGTPDVTAQNNSELYGKAQRELGDSALTNSTVVAAQRSQDHVMLVVRTPDCTKLVVASQILFSAPIILENLTPFDLDPTEYAIFSKVYYTGWYTVLVTDTGLKPGYVYGNAAQNGTYNIPLQPYTFRIGPTKVNTTYYAFFGSQTLMSEDEVKAAVSKNIQTLSGSRKPPKFLAFASHTPYKQQVSAQAVADGFYDRLNALQGYRGMYYTGNALDVSGSSSLFNFTRNLIPEIVNAVNAHPVIASMYQCSNNNSTES